MDIAALFAWVVFALGGCCLLGTWIQRGTIRQRQSGTGRLPAPVIFRYVAPAAIRPGLAGFPQYGRRLI